jgi:hypothetical protein
MTSKFRRSVGTGCFYHASIWATPEIVSGAINCPGHLRHPLSFCLYPSNPSLLTTDTSRPSFDVFLRRATRDELHALSDYILARVFNQQMYMIGCDNVVDDAESEALLRLEKPMQIDSPLACSEMFSPCFYILNGLNGATRLNDWNGWNCCNVGE